MPSPEAKVILSAVRASLAVSFTILLAACSVASRDDSLRVQGLGALSFPNSGMTEAQEPFLRGVLLLHVFRYDEAAAAFRRAQAADPTFALAYWGEAMTYDRPAAGERFRGAGLHALSRLAPTPEGRRARAATERERDWLYAVEMLFGPEDPLAGDAAYRETMSALVEKYPEDIEVRVFHALSLLSGDRHGRETTLAVAAALEPVLAEHPEHPGASHYLVLAHARPGVAQQGLGAARAYAASHPEAPGPLHAISTVLLANGAWAEAVASAEPALRLRNAWLLGLKRPEAVCDDYAAALQYGYLMSGRADAAATLLERCQERVKGGQATPSEAAFYISMRARQVLDTSDWPSATERWNVDVGAAAWARVPYDFVTAFAALRSGDPGVARSINRSLTRLVESADVLPQDELLVELLEAALLLDEGRAEDSVEKLRLAVAAEDELDPDLYAPSTLLPVRELLAEALLEQGQADEAKVVLSEALSKTPGRAPVQEALGRATSSTSASVTVPANRGRPAGG